MRDLMSKIPLVLSGLIGGVAFLISYDMTGLDFSNNDEYFLINSAAADQLPKVTDQMVCHAGKILPVLNQHNSTKSLTCMKQSTKKNQGYNNLADIFAEGWVVIDINNSNVWLFYK